MMIEAESSPPALGAASLPAPRILPRPRPSVTILLALATSLALSLGAMCICYSVLGVNLGLFFAGIFVVALLTPTLIVGEEKLLARGAVVGGIVIGVSAVWLYAALHESITLGDALACVAVAAGFATCLAGVALALHHLMRLPPAVASCATIVLALAWLTWPVWLSPWIPAREVLVERLASPHPLLSINAALRHLGLWDEQRYAYRMTALVRNVSYAPPAGVMLAAVFHSLFGGLLIAAVGASGHFNRRRVHRLAKPTDQ